MNLLHAVRNMIARARVDRPGGKPQLKWLGDRITPEVEVMHAQGVYFTAPAGAQGMLLAPAGDPSVAVAVGLSGETPDAPPAGEGGLHYLGTWKVYLDASGNVHLGQQVATDFVALATLVATQLTAIKTAFDAHVHTGVLTGGASSGPPAAPMPTPGSVAATKVKAV